MGFTSHFGGENTNAQNKEVESDLNGETKDICEIAFNQLSGEQQEIFTSWEDATVRAMAAHEHHHTVYDDSYTTDQNS